jgi:hypothetical protein
MDPITKAFVASMEHFSKEHQIPMVAFQKGQRKDDVMKEHLARFEKPEGVVFIGKAQEKTPVFRTEKRRNPDTGHTYPWIVRSSAMVNHFYCYSGSDFATGIGSDIRFILLRERAGLAPTKVL